MIDLPSMTALQAFDAALRHESFTRAAEELHRTQGAVSRQISTLERQLGLSLFLREHPHVRPTPAARAFGAKLHVVLERLRAVVLEVQATRGGGGLLHLSILPTFGTRWLIPRLADFSARHPAVELQLTTQIRPFDFDDEAIDAAIHYGEGVWPGARLERLMKEEVRVVCTAELAERLELRNPADLCRATLLQLDSRRRGWAEWLDAHEVGEADALRGPRFEHHLMVIQAALSGLGVALVPTFLCRPELQRGELIDPFDDSRMATPRAYWLAIPPRSEGLPTLEAFAGWLREEIAGELS